MTALILITVCTVGISHLCSLTEAALFAVSWSRIETLRREGRRSGELLYELRGNVDRPIAAVVTLNTLANTFGAAFAGITASRVMGTEAATVFVVLFSVLTLTVGEIIPKTLGVAHADSLATLLAGPLAVLTRLCTPLTRLMHAVNKLILPDTERAKVTEADILAMVSLSRKEGAIQPGEERLIGNILELDQKRVCDVMTPRTVVFSLPADMRLEDAYKMRELWNFSRIPVYGAHNEDLIGIVTRRDLARYTAEGNMDHTLGDLMRPIAFVLESQHLHRLLKSFLNSRSHLCAVLDEFGGLSGVVSLEDVLEEILGREIVDESDSVTDLRELARRRREALTRN